MVLKKENLRDNMSMLELTLNQLAEATTAEMTKIHNPQGVAENKAVARRGGKVAGDARKAIEADTGRPVITPQTAAQLNLVVTNLIEDVAAAADETEE